MSGDESTPDQRGSRKLKLVLKTSPLSAPAESFAGDTGVPKDGSSSPPRPSYSPVTPTLSHEKLVAQPLEKPEKEWIDEPAPMQRQQSLKDIRDLDKIKGSALEDPRGFADDLSSGKLKKPRAGEVVFDDVEYENEDNEPAMAQSDMSKFSRLPNAQNVARCPPIEWSKYHIIGKPLDDMHEMQKRHPGVSQHDFARGVTPQEHQVTAPYRPFKDKLHAKKETKG